MENGTTELSGKDRRAVRNKEIIALYRGGKTLREISFIYPAISFQRIHQILTNSGVKMRSRYARRSA